MCGLPTPVDRPARPLQVQLASPRPVAARVKGSVLSFADVLSIAAGVFLGMLLFGIVTSVVGLLVMGWLASTVAESMSESAAEFERQNQRMIERLGEPENAP